MPARYHRGASKLRNSPIWIHSGSMNPQDNTPKARKRGPRGGKTTVSKDGAMVRRAVYLDWEIVEAVRRDALRKHLSEAQALRQALREHYGLE